MFEEGDEVIVLMGLQVAFGKYAGRAKFSDSHGHVLFEDGVSALFLFTDIYPLSHIDKVERDVYAKISYIIESYEDSMKLYTYTRQVLQKKLEAING